MVLLLGDERAFAPCAKLMMDEEILREEAFVALGKN
jgi:hypothetical protein